MYDLKFPILSTKCTFLKLEIYCLMICIINVGPKNLYTLNGGYGRLNSRFTNRNFSACMEHGIHDTFTDKAISIGHALELKGFHVSRKVPKSRCTTKHFQDSRFTFLPKISANLHEINPYPPPLLIFATSLVAYLKLCD